MLGSKSLAMILFGKWNSSLFYVVFMMNFIVLSLTKCMNNIQFIHIYSCTETFVARFFHTHLLFILAALLNVWPSRWTPSEHSMLFQWIYLNDKITQTPKSNTKITTPGSNVKKFKCQPIQSFSWFVLKLLFINSLRFMSNSTDAVDTV